MTVFLCGGVKSGKSKLAQDLAVAMSRGGRRYYVATMIPVDAEDRQRICRHIAARDGLGFETIECGKNLLSCLDTADSRGTFLVDSVTALLQNAIFPAEKNYALDLDGARRCGDDLEAFVRRVRSAVIVSDDLFADAGYDAVTEIYRAALAALHRRLARVCDTVAELSAGQAAVYKGGLPL